MDAAGHRTRRYISWGTTGKVDYDFNDSVHLKVVGAYRTYESDWASDGDYTAFDLNTTLNLQEHEQTSFEAQLSGGLFSDKVQWTAGGVLLRLEV